MSSTQIILQVAHSFPLLKWKIDGYNPTEFDPNVLLRMSSGWSTSEIHLRNFVLSAWNPGWAEDNDCQFNLFGSFACFDGDTRETLIRWISMPGFPGRFL